METNGALDVRAVLGAERRFDIATDFLQRLCDRFDVRVAQVRILSYFCDRDAASHPAGHGRRKSHAKLTPSLGHSDFFTAEPTM